MEFTVKSIGKIYTPQDDRKTALFQPTFTDAFGTIVIKEESWLINPQ